MVDLVERRAAITAELATLARARGAAALENKRFDPAKIAALQDQLADIDAAEAEQTRRQRKADEKAFQAGRAEMCAELAAANEASLTALERADKAVHAARDAITEYLDTTGNVSRLAHELGGRHIAPALNSSGAARQVGDLLAATFRTIPGHSLRLGGVTWPSASLYRPDERWAERVRRERAAAIQSITGGQANGSESN